MKRLFKQKNRTRKDKATKKKMLDSVQCAYCGHYFGAIVSKLDGQLRVLKKCLDHFIPYHVCRKSDPENLIVCCQICNLIKRRKMFPGLEAASEYIKERFGKLYAVVSTPIPKRKILEAPARQVLIEDRKSDWISPTNDSSDIYEKFSLHEILEIHNLL